MKIRHTYLVCLLIVIALQLLFFSCHEKRGSSVEFPYRENLAVSAVRPTEEVFMRYPFRIRLNDSCLYVMDLHASDYYCHQFDYPSMRHKQSFAKRGEGPGEFLDSENIRLTQTSQCWVLDANNSRMSCFQTDESDSLAKKFDLDKRLIRTLDFDLYNDSMLIVPDYTGVHRFVILNPDGTINESRGRIPLKKKNKNIPDAAYAQAWRSFLDYNPENGLLAIATQLGEVIEIYSIPGDSLVNIVYGKEGEPGFAYRNGYAIPNGIMGYSDVYVGKNNIYALFWGHSFKDILRNASIEGGNNLYVFDLQGNPLKHYVLERHITGFFVNEKEGKFFGLDVNSDQPIIEFSL